MRQGIDISKHQGNVGWTKLAAQHRAGKLDFVIIRAGYGGGTVDPLWEENYAAARAAGIPVGAYWYAYWGKYSPAQEAKSFLKAVAGKELAMGIWYDVEYETDIIRLGKAERTAKVLEGLNALAASGRYVGLYASTDMVNNRLEYDRLRGYDLWVAQYASRNTCKLPYGLWQYTSGGSVEGISGRVDCDRAYKDYPAIVTGALAAGAGKAQAAAGPGGSKLEEAGGTGGNSSAGAGGAVGNGGDAGGTSGTDSPDGNREPRETHTYRVSGADKPKADQLIALCDKLELYILGRVEALPPSLCGPDKLLELAERLALDASGALRIGPATRGDLIQTLQLADSLGCEVRAELEIGPVSSGDAVTLKDLAGQMALTMEEVS